MEAKLQHEQVLAPEVLHGQGSVEAKELMDYCEYIWSSGKISEFMIRSIISRISLGDRGPAIVSRTAKTAI